MDGRISTPGEEFVGAAVLSKRIGALPCVFICFVGDGRSQIRKILTFAGGGEESSSSSDEYFSFIHSSKSSRISSREPLSRGLSSWESEEEKETSASPS